MNTSGWALDGLTTHMRFSPFERRFTQRLAQVTLDVDRVGQLAKDLRLFSYNKPNLYAFYDTDHGDRSGAPLRLWAERMFQQAGIVLDGGRIELTCFPRVAGTVFNPISIFVGRSDDGAVRGFIYEVNNTFGEQHAYVAPAESGLVHRHRAMKRFHVSPFLDVDGEYRFTMQSPRALFRLVVENWVQGRRQHLATLVSRRRPLTDAWLAARFASLPLQTIQVLGGIHWHALHIWLRGARYRDKPSPPENPTTLAHSFSNSIETTK